MIKSTKKNVIEVSDFNALVKETYERPYDFQQQDGCKERQTYDIKVPCEEEDFENDIVPEILNGEQMGVSFMAWLARDPKLPIAGETEDWCIRLFWHRNFYPHVSMIMNDLHRRGLIDAGEYLINIDW